LILSGINNVNLRLRFGDVIEGSTRRTNLNNCLEVTRLLVRWLSYKLSLARKWYWTPQLYSTNSRSLGSGTELLNSILLTLARSLARKWYWTPQLYSTNP
jgi:hypothetical protein